MVSVVVPTRNEAGNIGPLGDRLRAALGDVPYEICFVDDSDDETPAIVSKTGAGAQELIHYVQARMPEGEFLFPEDEVSDVPEAMGHRRTSRKNRSTGSSRM